jgi:hypothetical protein
MLKSKFFDNKNHPENMKGMLFDGIPVKRNRNMIYWYSWGQHTFDIRIMRKILDIPEEHPEDKWFMAEKPDFAGSFDVLMNELKKALGTKTFTEAMIEHDQELDKELKAIEEIF